MAKDETTSVGWALRSTRVGEGGEEFSWSLGSSFDSSPLLAKAETTSLGDPSRAFNVVPGFKFSNSTSFYRNLLLWKMLQFYPANISR